MRARFRKLALATVLVGAFLPLPESFGLSEIFSEGRPDAASRIPGAAAAQADMPETQESALEEIHSGPRDVRERIAVSVFLGWLWLSILVLAYVIRLKIREVDRLHNLSYFDTDGKVPPPET